MRNNRKSGVVKVVIAILEVQVLLVPMAYVIHKLFTKSFADAYVSGAMGLWLLFALGIIVMWWYGHVRAGATLLDLGPLHDRIWFFVAAAGFGFASVDAEFPRGLSDLRIAGLRFSDFGLSLMLFYGLLGMSHTRITEGGVWRYFYLIRWEWIHSFQCLENNLWQLRLIVPGFLRPFVASKVSIQVPPQHVDAFCRLLHEGANRRKGNREREAVPGK